MEKERDEEISEGIEKVRNLNLDLDQKQFIALVMLGCRK